MIFWFLWDTKGSLEEEDYYISKLPLRYLKVGSVLNRRGYLFEFSAKTLHNNPQVRDVPLGLLRLTPNVLQVCRIFFLYFLA